MSDITSVKLPDNSEYDIKDDRLRTARTRVDITSNLSNLSTAVSEQDLEKYGYSIGDYFTGASGYTYFLADLNFVKGSAANTCLSTNHIGIIVDTHEITKWETSGDASSKGYFGSTLHSYLTSTILNNIKSDMIVLFGGTTGLEHLLKRSMLMTTAFNNWAWKTDQYITALTESNISGHTGQSGNTYQEGEAVKPLELFQKYKWTALFPNEYVWLRNMQTGSSACAADRDLNLGYAWMDNNVGTAVGLIIFY